MSRSSYQPKPLSNLVEPVPVAPDIDPSLQRLFASLDAAAFESTAVARTAGGLYVAAKGSKVLLPTSYEAATEKSHVRG